MEMIKTESSKMEEVDIANSKIVKSVEHLEKVNVTEADIEKSINYMFEIIP